MSFKRRTVSFLYLCIFSDSSRIESDTDGLAFSLLNQHNVACIRECSTRALGEYYA